MTKNTTMNHGKEICRELKELRQRIAEENSIPLKMEECTFKGECDGTCPRCDAEVNYLETALADRLRLGKAAMVAGLSLGLAATAMDANCQTLSLSAEPPVVKEIVQQADGIVIRITGRVIDAKTEKGLEYAAIRFYDSRGRLIRGAVADKDGCFSTTIEEGKYNIEFSYYGYRKYLLENWNCTQGVALPTVKLEESEENEAVILTEGIIVPEKKHHLFGRKKQRSGGKK